jgi:hypothetical protein
MPLVQFGEHVANLFRWILEIGIERNDSHSPRLREAGQDGIVLAEVAGKHDDAGDVGSLLVLRAQQRDRPVGAAIVDEYDLAGPADAVDGGIEPREQLRQNRLLVVHGNDDAEVG